MAKQTINIGSSANDGTGTTIRAGGDLINDNFNEIYTELGDGTTLGLAAKSQTLTNKVLNGNNNTFSNIPGSALTNASFTLVDESSTEATISLGERMGLTGGTNLTSAITGDNINITLNSAITGITSIQVGTLSTSSGNLLVNPATQILEIRGSGSTEGQIQLNCRVNSHGQKIIAQPHSEGVTNEMLLPKGGNSTLVSEIATQTLTNKTIGVGQLTCNTRAYTGDGSTVAFTVTSGVTVDNVLVFLNGVFQKPTTDYGVSGTTLTFTTAPVSSEAILIKEL